jgi:hypothetical protein
MALNLSWSELCGTLDECVETGTFLSLNVSAEIRLIWLKFPYYNDRLQKSYRQNALESLPHQAKGLKLGSVQATNISLESEGHKSYTIIN